MADSACRTTPADPVEQEIVPPARDLGDGFTVKRALPSPQLRAIGPFVFFDQMGPARFGAGAGLDVRPHPHIGLATVTYVFDGEILHRDSLGTVQPIRPGEVNWMIAGRGIVHSERTPVAHRAGGSGLAGIQLWVGLPRAEEERPASFEHFAASQLPVLQDNGVRAVLIAGSLAGARSPVPTLSPLYYADAQLQAEATLTLEPEQPERAVFVCEGRVRIGTRTYEPGRMLRLAPDTRVQLVSDAGARLLLLGGEPLDGRRHLWWNFVSSDPARLRRAAQEWRDGRFGTVPDDPEFIPLPDKPLPEADSAPAQTVNYP